MLDGRRKSIQPMAERLPDGNLAEWSLNCPAKTPLGERTCPPRRRTAIMLQFINSSVAGRLWCLLTARTSASRSSGRHSPHESRNKNRGTPTA